MKGPYISISGGSPSKEGARGANPGAICPDWMRPLPCGKEISALGFCCCGPFAGDELDEDAAQSLLLTAWANGINMFDTSPLDQTGERRLGEFLAGLNAAEFVVTAKVGSRLVNGVVERSFRRDQLEAGLSGTLERLGLKSVDIVFLDSPELDQMRTFEVKSFFRRQKDAGRIRLAGVESTDPHVLEAALSAEFDVVMPHFNAATRELEPLLEKLRGGRKTVIAASALAGMKFSRGHWSLAELARRAKADPLFWWRGVSFARSLRKSGKSPHEGAIEYVLTNRAVTAGVFGSTDPNHVAANALAGRRAVQQQAA